MSVIIPLHIAPHGERIVIDTGRIRGVDSGDEPIFWLELFVDGGALIVWTGSTYPEALDAARQWARYGARVVDKIGGAA